MKQRPHGRWPIRSVVEVAADAAPFVDRHVDYRRRSRPTPSAWAKGGHVGDQDGRRGWGRRGGSPSIIGRHIRRRSAFEGGQIVLCLFRSEAPIGFLSENWMIPSEPVAETPPERPWSTAEKWRGSMGSSDGDRAGHEAANHDRSPSRGPPGASRVSPRSGSTSGLKLGHPRADF